MNYTSKQAQIHIKTLTLANTWYQVLTEAQAKGIRGYKIKSRFNGTSAPNSFDYAFTSTPAEGDTTTGNGYWSNTGSGSGDEAGPVKGIWARSKKAGCIIELMVFM